MRDPSNGGGMNDVPLWAYLTLDEMRPILLAFYHACKDGDVDQVEYLLAKHKELFEEPE